MSTINENALVSYSSNCLQVGDGQSQNCYHPYDDFWYRPYYTHWYPQTIYSESKIDKSFKIVTKLLEKGYLPAEMPIKKFMEIVNDISNLI